ncbi:MAG: hypothetical protein E6R03_15090 [Hyphomicrobiaceae bacterium]|nr:MAG: hypothetical protein E6R03_15090 [Hyphomicrobiaceae bacterium]
MKPVAIFDIDGTIADNNHRLHLITTDQPKAERDKFHIMCAEDKEIVVVTALLHALRRDGWEIWLFTARPEMSRAATEEWLRRVGIEYEVLEMRADSDHRCDVDAKRDMAARHDMSRVRFVVEDRNRCVDMWRGMGLCCLQCAPGDY